MSDNALNQVMELDHVIRVSENGTVTDAYDPYDRGTWAPEVYVDTDDDGQILHGHEVDMTHRAREEGWELLTGWSGQYAYSGPIMHPSEYIGGRLAEHILSTPGLYVAVEVTNPDDSDEPIGWAVAFREEN